MKLDTEADNVWEVEMPVNEVRSLLDFDLHEGLIGVIDSAQGAVFSKQEGTAYIVIKVVP
jgi:hypothetical protein